MTATHTTSATRWTRFGHDRLYVNDHEGRRMGWVDLRTGGTHPVSPAAALVLAEAFTAWVTSTSWEPGAQATGALAEPQPPRPRPTVPAGPGRPVYGPVARGAAAPPAPPPPGAPEQDWYDLAATPPGAAARSQARALAQAAPVRTFLSRLVGRRTDERAWRLGADGEELVADQLHRLRRHDPRWRLLHAVPVGDRGSDIDHVVMGPGGVFTLNAKHHPGADVWVGGDMVMVKGQRHPYVRNSRHEAARASRLLLAASGVRTPVTGVVVPVGARRVTVRTAPEDVAVVPLKQLVSWLQAQPHVLDDHTLWWVSEVARRSTTWQPRRP